jgi:hypothetical protein
VDVTADFYGRIYRNRHTYSNYQLFSVESGDKAQAPKPGSDPVAPQ